MHAAEPVTIYQTCLLYSVPIHDSTFARRTTINVAPRRVFDNTIGTQRPVEPCNRRHDHLLYLSQGLRKSFRIAWCRVISRYMNGGGREVRQQRISSLHQSRYSC